MIDLTARLIALRRQHPLLRDTRFLRGDIEVLPGVNDVAWFDERGQALTDEAWQDPEARTLTLRRAGLDRDGEIEVVLLVINGSHDDVTFVLPPPRLEWNVLADSTSPAVAAHDLYSEQRLVGAHGFLLLAATPRHAAAEPPASALAPHAAAD